MRQFSSFECVETKNLNNNVIEKSAVVFQPFSIIEEENFLDFHKL